MSKVEFEVNEMYKAWRTYLLANSDAKYFGMVFDSMKQAKFPYANFKMIGRPTNGGDLEGDEASVNLTIEAEAYINTNKYESVYGIDNASADFLIGLGFRRVGNAELLKVSDTVTKIQSRFSLPNFCGRFLREISNE